MKNLLKYILPAVILLSLATSAEAALMSPSGSSFGGLLFPQTMTFTTDGTGAIPSNSLNIGSISQPVPFGYFSNLLFTGSSTLQNFTFASATGTNATTTNLYVSNNATLSATGGKTAIGTTTPRSLFSVAAGITSTTTIDLGERTCFNVGNTASSSISFYFVGTTITVENNRCK